MVFSASDSMNGEEANKDVCGLLEAPSYAWRSERFEKKLINMKQVVFGVASSKQVVVCVRECG